MSEKIIQIDVEAIRGQLKELVYEAAQRKSSTSYWRSMRRNWSDCLIRVQRIRQDYRCGHYSRNFTITARDFILKVTKLRGISDEVVIIERYRRWESGVEEAFIEMYLAGASVQHIEDILSQGGCDGSKWQSSQGAIVNRSAVGQQSSKVKLGAKMLKATHAQERQESCSCP